MYNLAVLIGIYNLVYEAINCNYYVSEARKGKIDVLRDSFRSDQQ